MKIVVVSDNHGNEEVLKEIEYKHYNADYYFHLGDSQMGIESLRPFVSVMGNNDYDFNLPSERVIDVGKYSFYLTHGHAYGCDLKMLYKQAKILKCDFVLFGHTHEYLDTTIGNIRILNPGSCSNNRFGKYPSYIVIEINNNEIVVNKYEIK